MNRNALIVISILFTLIFYLGCPIDEDIIESPYIPGLTLDNYPKVDGSTSTDPLNILIACKLLGIKHQWKMNGNGWFIEPVLKSNNNLKKFEQLIRSSQTHWSILNLIDKKADIILSARTMSPEEKDYADSKGIVLIETPIALDAFIFLINPNNPITSLTIEQIQDIYTGNITNWNEIGGDDAPIVPFIRNQNSGSQELMDSLVMDGFDIMNHLPWSDESFYKNHIISSMIPVFDRVWEDKDAICYTVYYFKEYILRDKRTKSLAINGIPPSKENIENNIYPLSAEVYAVIRSDLDKSSIAYKIYEWIQTENGKEVISESGYIPN